MAFQTSHVRELQREEKRLLDKIKARANQLQAGDPLLSSTAALAQAIRSMPSEYRDYVDVRYQLGQLRVPPQLDGLGLSQGE